MNCYVRLACSMCFQLTNAVQCARLTPPTSEQGALTCSGCNQKRSHCDAWLSPTKHTEISDCFLFANDNDNHGSVGHKISALVYSTYVCCECLLIHFLKLGHDWMFAVFALITAPDWAQLNSTSSEIFRILRLAKNSLICRHFQLGSVGRNRKPDHIASGAVIMLTTEPNWRVGVSCSQLCSVVLSFKPVGRCDRGSIRFDRKERLRLYTSFPSQSFVVAQFSFSSLSLLEASLSRIGSPLWTEAPKKLPLVLFSSLEGALSPGAALCLFVTVPSLGVAIFSFSSLGVALSEMVDFRKSNSDFTNSTVVQRFSIRCFELLRTRFWCGMFDSFVCTLWRVTHAFYEYKYWSYWIK